MDVEISVLVLAHNKAAYTQRCLDGLLHSSLRPFQLVLVNNGSTDDTAACFAAFCRRVVSERVDVSVLDLPEHLGAIVGRNRGMERLRGKYWVFLDNDVVVRTRSWLERLRGVLEADPGIGVVAPKLVYPVPPYDIQCAGCSVTTGGRVIFEGRGQPRGTDQFAAPRDCQALISATWMMSAAVARKVGLLDERFSPVQFEDIDYCYRVRELGLRCRYEPAVEMYHFENVTSGRTGAINYPYVTVKNGLKFKEKWRHRFMSEGGPPDRTWVWASIPSVRLDDVAAQLEITP